MPAITAPVDMAKIMTEFGGGTPPAALSAYVRSGAYVPNTPANAAISTTVVGLAISQFLGASNSTPLSAYMNNTDAYNWRGTSGTLQFVNNIYASGGTGSYTYSTVYLSGDSSLSVANGTLASPRIDGYSPVAPNNKLAQFRTVVTSGAASITLDWNCDFEWGNPA